VTPLEALIIWSEYKNVAYPSKAAGNVISEAKKVLSEEATSLMRRETSGLCVTCWGDGFHRSAVGMLSGPCEACQGSGRRPDVGHVSTPEVKP
jgi:hypothetical protein